MLQHIISDCLNKGFDKNLFTKLCSELSGSQFDPTQELISCTNADVQEMLKIGGLLNTGIDFVVIWLQSGNISNKRVKHRNIAKWYLEQYYKEAGIFAFVDNNNTDQWRLSFVRLQYVFEDGKPTEKVSSAKRYSYLVGKGKNIRTVTQQLLWLGEQLLLDADTIQQAFAVEPLNKEFYNEVSEWYNNAVKIVKYSDDLNKHGDGTEESLIRFLTRILFCWFLREKGLISGDIFNKDIVKNFVKIDADNNSYYKAILQNLFFATLNKKRDERDFSKKNHTTRTILDLYRYEDLFFDAGRFINTYFKDIPFLNGGLFECLDYESDTEKTSHGNARVMRIDVFTDNTCENTLKFPNDILLGEKGLFEIFNRYQFTIEESSAQDVNVALDPELLGLIFENLLASYNPETQQSARKETGSFYTPRDVVQHMIRASLKQYFLNKGIDNNEIEKLYNGDKPDNTDIFINAIDNIKVFDPACGSGAFPMGLLQELVHFLEILDPDNTDSTFAKNDSNYKRKLCLIEKCIYGTDIQPIATQITKLRFFISLLIEQIPDNTDKDNFGILPLPNLEIKFIAADSLLLLDKQKQQLELPDERLGYLKKELKTIRKNYFSAQKLKEKRKYKIQDIQKRQQITDYLQKSFDWTKETAEKIANWDLYNQNAPAAKWFDAEWMFGMTDGFDIVIGNPPYIQLQKDGGRLAEKYKDVKYSSFARAGDIYVLFFERGHQILNNKGVLCYITSNKWMRAGYGKALRHYLSKQTQPHILIDMGPGVFTSATVDTNILLFSKQPNTENRNIQALTLPSGFHHKSVQLEEYVADKFNTVPLANGDEQWTILTDSEQRIKEIIEQKGIPLKDWDVDIYRGVLTGYNPAFIINKQTRKTILSNCKTDSERQKTDAIIRPVLRGRDIKKYQANWADLWLIGTHNGYTQDTKTYPPIDINDFPALKKHLSNYWDKLENRTDKGITPYNLRSCKYWSDFYKPKIVWSEMTKKPCFIWDESNVFTNQTCYFIPNTHKYYLPIFNSHIIFWYFINCLGADLGTGAYRWIKQYVEMIPIPKMDLKHQEPFNHLVDYIQFCNQHALTDMAQYFTELVDIMVFGLYFADKMQQKECYINDSIGQFTEPLPNTNTDQQQQFLMSVYQQWQKESYLAKAFADYKSVEEIQVILQADTITP